MPMVLQFLPEIVLRATRQPAPAFRLFPPLAGSTWVNGRDIVLARIVLHGLQGSVSVGSATYNGAMPGFGTQLSDSEIASVLTYIRSQWGNRSDSVAASTVKAQRAISAAHDGPWNGEADLNSPN